MKKEGAQSDEQSTILQRIAEGDKSAVEICFNKYGNLIWYIASNAFKTKEDAEDAVQEIFIDIWKNAARFDETKSPEKAFILMIARRRVTDRLRKVYQQPTISSLEDISFRIADHQYKKLQMYLELKPAFEAVNKLKSNQKQFIFMSVYKGMSHEEIAKTSGLPLGTVKSQIRRGFQKIRSSIESFNKPSVQNRIDLKLYN